MRERQKVVERKSNDRRPWLFKPVPGNWSLESWKVLLVTKLREKTSNMATTTSGYLEQYLDSLENLPSELKKNFNRMHDLDTKNKDILVDIDTASDDYLRKVRDLSPTKRKAEMEKIQVRIFYHHMSHTPWIEMTAITIFFVLGPEIYCRPVLLEMYRFTSNFNLFFVLSNTIPQSQFRKTPQGKSSKYFVI